jgi:hypothetical protein
MECLEETEDISQQPPMATPTTNEEEEEEGNSPQESVKKFLVATPLISLLVGGALLVTEVTVIVLILVSPRQVGVAEEDELEKEQRAVLGAVSVLMLVEAMALGSINIGTRCTTYIH